MIQRPVFSINSFLKSRPCPYRYLLRSGRSALDEVTADAIALQSRYQALTTSILDQYFTSRDRGKRMGRQLAIINNLCQPSYKLPSYDPITQTSDGGRGDILRFDVLALETESSRVMSQFLDGLGQVFSIDGKALGAGYHGLSHHGNDPAMIQDLITIETAHMHGLSGFIKQLQEKKTVTGKSLLDDTIVLVGTGMGDASRHSNRDLPTLVFGGGFKHKGHLSFDHNSSSSRYWVICT